VKLSVVVRSYNEERHIGRLLLGISQQTLPPHEVIVVDSGSTDSTVAIARDMGARIVPIDKRDFTFGRALNVGCAAATGDILVFASAHVYPTYRDWLERLARGFDDERVQLVYGRQTGNHLTQFSEMQIFNRWFPSQSVSPQKSYFCNNANCAIRTSAWQRQPYDEALSGLEDLAWAKVIQAKGGWIAYDALAEIVHVHEETWDRVRNRYRREAIAMRHIDDKASFSAIDFINLLIGNTMTDMRHARREKKLRAHWRQILAFRFNQILGTYQGYNGAPEITDELRRRFYFPHRGPRTDETFAPAQMPERIDYDLLEQRPKSAATIELEQKSKRLSVIK